MTAGRFQTIASWFIQCPFCPGTTRLPPRPSFQDGLYRFCAFQSAALPPTPSPRAISLECLLSTSH
eukprot:2002976-Pleurochrysis_carterae.AAC.1